MSLKFDSHSNFDSYSNSVQPNPSQVGQSKQQAPVRAWGKAAVPKEVVQSTLNNTDVQTMPKSLTGRASLSQANPAISRQMNNVVKLTDAPTKKTSPESLLENANKTDNLAKTLHKPQVVHPSIIKKASVGNRIKNSIADLIDKLGNFFNKLFTKISGSKQPLVNDFALKQLTESDKLQKLFDPQKVQRTIDRANAVQRKSGEEVYGKKTFNDQEIDSYSFTITKNNQLIISSEVLDKGSFKKVNQSYNLTTGQELVKLSVKNSDLEDTFVDAAKIERETHIKLAKDNPDIQQPHKIAQLVKMTSVIDGRTSFQQEPLEKLIFYENKLIGDATKLDSTNITAVLNATECLLRGLAKLHKQGYVHMDIKRENLFVEDADKGIIKLSDFGTTVRDGEKIRGYTGIYSAPEAEIGKVANPKNDSYAAGYAIMELLCGKKLFSRYEFEDEKNHLKDPVQLALFDLAQKLLVETQKERLTCAEAFKELAQIKTLLKFTPDSGH